MLAAKTTIPVIGVPLVAGSLDGLDALMSIVQMPPGIPVGTMALGKPGAINSALFAAAILALTDTSIGQGISAYREKQKQKFLNRSWIDSLIGPPYSQIFYSHGGLPNIYRYSLTFLATITNTWIKSKIIANHRDLFER